MKYKITRVIKKGFVLAFWEPDLPLRGCVGKQQKKHVYLKNEVEEDFVQTFCCFWNVWAKK